MPQPLYPILLDVTDRLCMIIGGGTVAARKAQGLINAGSRRVHMIAPEFSPDVPESVRRVYECYRPEHLEQAGIVFAATNIVEVNDAVVRDAKARGILVNRSDTDEDSPGDFVTAATLRNGPVTVAVSAGSAALSVMIRDRLAFQWKPGWTALAEAMVQMRPEIKKQWDEETRRKIFRDMATEEAIDILASQGLDGLRNWIARRHGNGTGAGT
jgi:precorrin-2 dehydrogenase / sirohydrochlorin ferrochelatase